MVAETGQDLRSLYATGLAAGKKARNSAAFPAGGGIAELIDEKGGNIADTGRDILDGVAVRCKDFTDQIVEGSLRILITGNGGGIGGFYCLFDKGIAIAEDGTFGNDPSL